jgi:predicted HicB family RNase H-like nuclease
MPSAVRKPLTFDVERSPPPPRVATPAQLRQQVGARVTATVYRQLKARAALQGVAVGALVEQAISEFLERAAAPNQDAA